ncbi:MAG: potassium channel protein [Desulfobacterales bacterium]|nr:potassium channel protein [Desulfobacterales bacterium]
MKHFFSSNRNRYVALLLFSLVCLFLLGMGGYMVVEERTPVEALYLTIGTLTTVAPFQLSEGGRIFAIFLIIFGFGLVAATAALLGNMFLDGSTLELYRRRKVRKKLKNFTNHYVICGHGQMGQIVTAELFQSGLPLVVIDNDERAILPCKEHGLAHLHRDAMEEENLIEAGVERARGLISVVNRDADNVFIVLTARALNPDMFICARASSKGVEKKLFRAGADHVVSPYASAAMRITQNILRPTITDFLDSTISGKEIDLAIEELEIPESAPFVNKSMMDANIRNDFDLIVVAIKRADGTRIYNPSSLELIHAGDTLIFVGPQTNIDQFFEKIHGKGWNSKKKGNNVTTSSENRQ